jgi:hypothetical protein
MILCHLNPLREAIDGAEWELLRYHSMWLPNLILLLVANGPEFVRSLISQPRQVLVELIPTDGLIPEDWDIIAKSAYFAIFKTTRIKPLIVLSYTATPVRHRRPSYIIGHPTESLSNYPIQSHQEEGNSLN